MNRKTIIATAKWCVFLGLAISSQAVMADPMDGARVSTGMQNVRFEFTDPRPAGFETDHLQDRLDTIQVRGWRVSNHAYFGQTRVAHHSGFGLVYQNGNTLYQVNNRGLQVTRYF